MPHHDDEHKVAEIIKRLQQACLSFDEGDAEEATDQLIAQIRSQPDPVSTNECKRALQLLRRRRHFDLMERLADALILSGQDAPVVRRQYAQAQLDRGNISSAIRVLSKTQSRLRPGRT